MISSKYQSLRCELMKHKVVVIDSIAYGWGIDVKNYDYNYIIYVDRTFSMKKKLFTLAHEAGHFFTLRGRLLIPTKIAKEEVANKRAVRMLNTLDVSNAEKEYLKFYEWIRGKVFLRLVRDKNTKWTVTKA